jgi:hypothetical protein
MTASIFSKKIVRYGIETRRLFWALRKQDIDYISSGIKKMLK